MVEDPNDGMVDWDVAWDVDRGPDCEVEYSKEMNETQSPNLDDGGAVHLLRKRWRGGRRKFELGVVLNF